MRDHHKKLHRNVKNKDNITEPAVKAETNNSYSESENVNSNNRRKVKNPSNKVVCKVFILVFALNSNWIMYVYDVFFHFYSLCCNVSILSQP